MNLQQLITDYGYISVLIGTFLEGETILIIAGFMAHRGYLELPLVILAAFIGTVIGDQLYFYIGRIKGQAFLEKRPKWKPKVDKVQTLLDKHQTLLILGFRFIYGIRTVTPFILGMSKVSPVKYLLLNICGALLWAIAFGVAGFYFGATLELLIDKIKKYEILIIVVITIISVFIWIRHLRKEKKLLLKNKSL